MKERIEKSSTPKSDRRLNRIKEAIGTVFKEMVCELPYEKITVKGIAERAGINRNTFYLHYASPDDVLREIQTEHSDRYSALIANCRSKNDVAALVRNFFEYMEAQDDFFKTVTCDGRFDYIRERMQNRVAAKTYKKLSCLYGNNKYEQNIVLTFLGTVLYLYRQWVLNGRKISLKRVIEISTTLMDFGMQWLRNE